MFNIAISKTEIKNYFQTLDMIKLTLHRHIKDIPVHPIES